MGGLLVQILMGSESDSAEMSEAEKVLEGLGVNYQTSVASAHRNPEGLREKIRKAEEGGAEVFIAGAGMAAHLPGFIASHTTLPVIGVPLNAGQMGGLDSLLSMVQMPTGVPVATVAVGGVKNAALLAAEILSLKHPDIRENLIDYRRNMEKSG